ncbi:TonB-dependent receptor domain-containing protein [Rheinheimera sp. WS51]|uniref:TonB-dependent receptor domain-containing protein n=1 Tax=Rheinheimera sp. WS51 TaxID=3425886 RepID=UPI003D8ED29F
MYTNNKLSKAVKLAIAFGAASVTAFTASVNAAEQDETAKVERIEVTGSRLRSTDLQGFSPVQVIGAEDIDTTGVANIQELLLKNPAFGTPGISRTNSNFSTAAAGVSTIDLRNLGTARTLVLVNGRRYVTGVPGSMAVDLNTIPAQFIERIEIMTGGASAVYGSDAVAGVVNIILKKEFEGVEFDVQYGESSKGDAEETQVQFTTGVTSANGKGNVMIHGAYTDQGAVYSKDRARSAVDIYSEGAGFTGDPADFFTPVSPFNSSYAPQGRFFTGNTQFTYNSAGELIEGWSTNGSDTQEANGFNRNGVRTIAIPTERYLLGGRGSYEFTDNWTSFLEGTYAATQTTTQLEPFPFATGDIYPTGGGQMPIEFENFIPDPNDPSKYIRQVTVNPMIPQPIVDAATDTNGDGLRDIFFTRRLADVANRGNVADRSTFRLVGGVEGEITDGWYADAYFGYGETKESQVSSGQVNVLNFRNALEVIPDGQGGVMCRDEIARAQGCVPADVYGANTLSDEAVKYISAPGLLATFASQKFAGFNVSGELFEMPAGFVGLAAGMEYREEFSRSEFDPLQQAGLNAGNAIPRTEGKYDVTEYYTEVNVPLLSDVFMADQLNLRGAVRLSDYSTVGNTTSWNVALDWAPIPELRMRLVRAQSVRAPNVDELYSPPSQTFPTGLTDPCLGVTNSTTGTLADNCRAAPGVQENIDTNGEFTLNQSDIQGVSGYNRGNEALDAEKGKSWTLGFTYSPEGFLSDFDFNVDYFDIEIEDAIVGTPRQFILDQCYNGDASLCQFITRRATSEGANSAGSLEYIDSGVTNSGGFATEGVDVVVTYGKDLEDFDLAGRVNARLSYTHLLDGYAIPLPGSEKDVFAGEIGAPENKFYLSLGYSIGDVSIAWNTTYIGKASFDDQWLAGYDLAPGSVGVGSTTYHDLNVSYKPNANYELYLGLQNAFDKEPAPIISGLPGNSTGTETNASVFDPIGRRMYAGVRMTF